MGAVFACPPILSSSLERDLVVMRDAGIRVVVAATDGDPLPRPRLEHPQLALVLGNEGRGVSRQLRALADMAIALPMAPGADSLSVTAAGAILMFAARHV